ITAGLTGTWVDNGVVSVPVSAGGSGYVTAPAVTASGGGSDAGKTLPTLVAVLGTGADAGRVVSVTITNPGKAMSVAPSLGFSGTGAAATANFGDIANPFRSRTRSSVRTM